MNLIQEALKELQEFEGEKFLLLTTTIHPGNPDIYKARTKKYLKQIAVHFLFKKSGDAKSIVTALKNSIDFLVIESENKINLDLRNEIKDIELDIPVLKLKPNDYTVDSLIQLIQTISTSSLKITVIGCGNIGCKSSLALAEIGHQVRLISRDLNKSNEIISSFLKFAHINNGKLLSSNSWEESVKEADYVILTASGEYIITEENLQLFEKAKAIIDVGGSGIHPTIIGSLKKTGKKIYSLDSSPGLFGSILSSKISYIKYHNAFLNTDMVPIGELGARGQKLYDPLVSPTAIIGICDGNGGFLKS